MTGAQILDQTRAFLARFVSMPSAAALDVATLWTAHTHCVDSTNERLVFDTSPRLAFLSDSPASGKTRALELVMMLANRGQSMIDPTPAGFAIMVAEQRATVAIDEIDILFGAGAAKSVLRSLLNSGYKRGSIWTRANKDSLPVFSPVLLAGLGQRFRTSDVLSALRTRCIIVNMVPCSDANRPEIFRTRLHSPTANYVRDGLSAWCRRHAPVISQAFPLLPDGISDRLGELCEPLLQIADVAGGHWPETARAALVQLLRGDLPEDDEIEPALPLVEQLFADMARVFAQSGADRLSSVALCDALRSLDAAPWAGLWPSATAAPRELAALLGPYGIEPSVVRVSPDLVLRGYRLEDVEPLFPVLTSA